ncbi:alpha/beta fold hydrolase [Pseudonocardia sp. RS010]|uniref:alpha/beta fold hydrolase n=1 Tax=Pseudonocardia sp. RS010 TaxID=3385979 RepID=UPI0039A319F2
MTTYVLVPGFWSGAWVWDAVAAELRAAGHEVHPVALGHEPDATAESHVDDVVQALEQAGPAVLVGHSGGGPVCAAAAERARDRVTRLVFVDTGPLPDGTPQIDFNPPEAQEWIRARVADRGAQPMPTRAEFARLGTSTEGLDDETFADLHARSLLEPAGVILTGVRRGRPDPSLPKTVVACSFTEAQARELIAAGVPAFAEMAGPEWSFVELATGHWPMLGEPVALAELLAGLGDPA